jgi:hypothetical protein
MKAKLILPIIVLILTLSLGTVSAADLSEYYYFTAYDAGVTWATNPANMVDGTETNYASTTTNNDAQLLNVNNCTGTDLGAITSVEIRAYGYYSGNDEITLVPIFNGATGDDHTSAVPATTGAWGTWFDITSDTNAPGTWAWTDVVNLDTTVNYVKSGGAALTYVGEVEVRVNYTANNAPVVSNISMSHVTIKGGNTVTIYANSTLHEVNDTDGVDTVQLFCNETETVTSLDTTCTSGVRIDATDPYDFTCSFPTPADDLNHTIFCRLYDGTTYSTAVNESYVTDSSAPSLSIYSVAGDTSPSYFDTANEGTTDINITGEAGMSCKWSSTDTTYNGMSSACIIQGATANCSVNDVLSQGYYTRYISCQDSLTNQNTAANNLDVSFYLDYTNPTTSDNSVSTVQAPPYTVTITELDNVDGDPTTLYCTDITNACNPDTAIDNGGTVIFTSANRGANYFRYNSTDDAGNQQTTVSKTININQLPTFTSATDSATTIAGGATVNISTVVDDLDNQEVTLWVCSSEGATSAGCTGTEYCNFTEVGNVSCTFTAESDSATHNWYAYIYDASDEAAITNKTGSYTTDVTSPTITIVSPIADTTYTQASLTFTITVNEALTNAWYTINDTTNVSMSNTSLTVYTHTNTSIEDGNWNMTFWANDSYGNQIESSIIAFIIDTTVADTSAPEITVWSPVNNSYLTLANVLLNITTNENLSWANYSDNGGAQSALGNITHDSWNKTVVLAEGEHNISFYVNDSATGDNFANTTVTFYVDLNNATIDSFSCTDNVNDSLNITCNANVNDSVGLDYAIIGHNTTGTFQNSSQISLSGTSDTATYVIDNANTAPGNFTTELYVYDLSGQLNYTSIEVNVSDDTLPTIGNISYVPNTTLELDPNVQINVSADITEDYLISTVVLMYQNTTDTDWTVVSMMNTSTSRYNASFTPENGTYTFAINATDLQGNQQLSDNTTIIVQNDTNTTITTTIQTIESYTIAQAASNNSLGDFLLNNTGDTDLNITVNLSASNSVLTRLSVNYTTQQNETYTVSSGNFVNISVEANTTDLPIGLYPYNVSVTYNPTIVYERYLNIQSANGPYLEVSITEYSATADESDEINLTATVTNQGTADATGVFIIWTLPDDWTINSGSASRDIGNLPLGVSATNTLTTTVGSTGTVTITANANSTEAVTASDSKSVTVGTPTTITQTIASESSSSGGGGGGSSATEYTETETIIEVVRGTKETIPITITNTYPNSIINDVTITIDGFISQYVTISPDILSGILPGENKTFNLIINAPTYLDQDEYVLKSKITGSIVYGNLTKTLTDKRTFTLLIQEMSNTEVSELIEQAKQDIADMKQANFTTTKTEKLLASAEACLEAKDNTCARDLANQIHETRLTAFSTYEIMQEIENAITKSEARKLDVPETKNMYNLALAAFNREDYDTALQRIKDAQLTLALETKGRINIIWLITTYWWALILGGIASYFLGLIIYKKFMAAIIAQRLKNLDKEEKTIQQLIKDTQKELYVKKTLSSSEYKTRILGYNTRILKIKSLRAKLRHRRVAILKKEEQIKDIEKERAEVIGMIKHAQTKYFTLGKISRERYNEEIEKEKERLAEIEDEKATLETELAKEQQIKTEKKRFSFFERKVLDKAEEKKLRKHEKKISLKDKLKQKRIGRRELNIDMSSNKTRRKNKAKRHFEKLGFKVKRK